jgi:hypothetical protein
MRSYRVFWEMDIEADCPEEAAQMARYYQTKPSTTATVFDVRDEKGELTRIDLLEDEDDE